MKKMISMMCVAAVCTLGAGLSAQSSAMDKGQMDRTDTMKNEMTMSGCVTAGKNSGQYMLTNAMMMGGMMDKEMAKDKMKDPAMGAQMMSYELVGGRDLKAHMGHQVEVTGMMSKTDMDRMMKMQKMEKMDKDKMDKMSDKEMKAMKLNVKSIKMTSSTCS